MSKAAATHSNCWAYVKSETGWSLPRARDLKPNTQMPIIGAIVIEHWANKSSNRHFSIIKQITDDGVIVKEDNFPFGKHSETRIIPFDSPHLIGFYYE